MSATNTVDMPILNKQNFEVTFDDAIINIRDLRLRTYIGFNPEELSKRQDVVINAAISYRAGQACESDDELNALNYKPITKNIISLVEQGQFRLLEKLASELLALVMSNDEVTRAKITVDKPHALRFSDSVGITLSASRKISLI
jgi:D-erythro-7,8-dihydroneopterin triphosphate epimerase